MRRALGFIPLVFYALGFLLFGGLILFFYIGARSTDDPGAAISFLFLLMFPIIPAAIASLGMLIIKILHVATRLSLFGILCTVVDLCFAVNAIRLFISYMTDSIPFGTHEITLVVLAVVSTLSFITNASSIRS